MAKRNLITTKPLKTSDHFLSFQLNLIEFNVLQWIWSIEQMLLHQDFKIIVHP
jgi:hypothetical protein